MLPPVRQDLIEEDSMPVEIIDRLKHQLARSEQRIAELEAENERLNRTNSSYASLTKAQESQLTNLRQRLYQLKGADSAIDSERQANHELTEQLAASQLHAEQLRVLIKRAYEFVRDDLCNDGLSSLLEALALSIPSDASALDAYVAEKMKEAMK